MAGDGKYWCGMYSRWLTTLLIEQVSSIYDGPEEVAISKLITFH